MLRIFSDSFLTATRQKDWDSPDYWRFTDQRPITDRAAKQARQREMRRWMRDTGIM